MSQPKIPNGKIDEKVPKNRKDPDYGSKPKKHYDATPSDTGTTDQSIWNTILHALAPTKFAPLTPAVIVFRLFLALIIVAGLAQAFGMIDVTGFLNPKSPTYLDVNSVLFPDKDEELLENGVQQDDDTTVPTTNKKEESSTTTSKCKATSCDYGMCCGAKDYNTPLPSLTGGSEVYYPTTVAFCIPDGCPCPSDTTLSADNYISPSSGNRCMCECNNAPKY